MTDWGITREEFGLDLFEIVKLCAGVEQLRANKNIHPSRIKPGQLTDWALLERAHIARIATVFPQLTPEQQADVLDRFPWVVQC
jgi:hypothetical protein